MVCAMKTEWEEHLIQWEDLVMWDEGRIDEIGLF